MSLKQDFIDSIAQEEGKERRTQLTVFAKMLFDAADQLDAAVAESNSGIDWREAERNIDNFRIATREWIKRDNNLTDAELSRLIELLK